MNNTQKPAADYFSGHRSDIADMVPMECVRILDVGCGYGGLGRILRTRGVAQVFGVEINPDAASRLDEVYADYWIGDVEQVNLPAGIEAFDCIVFADVLEHLRDPWGTLKRYLQWLKPGGNRRQHPERAQYRLALQLGAPRTLALRGIRAAGPHPPALFHARRDSRTAC